MSSSDANQYSTFASDSPKSETPVSETPASASPASASPASASPASASPVSASPASASLKRKKNNKNNTSIKNPIRKPFNLNAFLQKSMSKCPPCDQAATGRYIYSVFHSIMALVAIYLSFRCNKGFSLGPFFIALLCPYIYIIYIVATKGTCGIFEKN